MINVFSLGLSLIAGMVFGLFYFGGLWMTIQRLPLARHPVLLAVTGMWLRTAVVLGGFFVVMDGRWQQLIACLIGFVLMRVVLVYRWGGVANYGPSQHPSGGRGYGHNA